MYSTHNHHVVDHLFNSHVVHCIQILWSPFYCPLLTFFGFCFARMICARMMMVMTVGAIMIGVTAMVVMAINSFLVNLPSPPITHCLPSCHLVFHCLPSYHLVFHCLPRYHLVFYCLPNCFFIVHYLLGHSIVIHHLLNHLVSLL